MLQLHYFPGNASLIAHIVLEELGVPFELKYVDRAASAHKSADYLALNPNGLIPVLVDPSFGSEGRPLVVYETAAVCMHLADTHPVDRLLPPLGSAERAQAYKWLAWLANTLHATLILYFYPERWGDAAAAAQLRASAEAKIGTLLDQLDAEFARHGRPWLLGDAYSVCDPYAFVLCRWTRGFSRPARSLPHLQPFLARMLERPAVRRAFTTEGLKPPLV
jgi:glutathione S-transferase